MWVKNHAGRSREHTKSDTRWSWTSRTPSCPSRCTRTSAASTVLTQAFPCLVRGSRCTKANPTRAASSSGAPLVSADARTPIVFSRVATFACRTAQALLGSSVESLDPSADGPAPGRAQLYVDDPIVSVRASAAQAKSTLDLVVLWWLVLGIPLSWKKGFLSSGSEPHRWIGIDYTLTAEGALMRLPPAFVADLLARLLPLCSPSG